MPTPKRCARCGIHAYHGELVIDGKSFSLCNFCLPIVRAKIEGFITDHLLMEA